MSIFAYQNIPKEIFPNSTLDKISIRGGYVGASGNVLDKMVVKTIEDDLKSISEIDTVYSTIQNGSFNITADIKTGNDSQKVLGDVKDVVSNVKRDLPSDMDEPVAKILPYNYPLMLVAISGEVKTRRLIEVAEELKSRLSLLGDLNSIDIRGKSDEEILITLDQKKIDAYGLSKGAVYKAISSISSIFPVGTIKEQGNHLYISTINGEKDKDKLEKTLLSVGGKRFYLKDIATVAFDLGDPKQLSHFNGKPNISINITKNEQGNAIALAKEIRKVLAEYTQKYRGEITFEAYADTSTWIKNRLNLVSSNILFGLILVMFALFLTLNFRIAFVVGIGIPTSFMITLIFADMIGYSLNMLTLLGTLIALGMLVDEAIVVAENIYRHIEKGKSPREATIDGAVEMFPAIVTSTLTTVFAFLPLLIMSGKMGMFIKVLPIMISILLLSSLFEAFYFLPIHAKEFFSIGKLKKIQKDESDFWKIIYAIFGTVLSFLLRFKWLSLIVIVGSILFGTVIMAKQTKFQMFPEFDVQQVYINGKVNINNELKETEVFVSRVEDALMAKLDKQTIDSITSVVGFRMNADMTTDIGDNLFQIIINLHEKAPENFFDRYINPHFSLEYDDSDMIREKKAQELVKEIQEGILKELESYKIDNNRVYEELNIFAQQTGIVGHDIEIGFSSLNQDEVLGAIDSIKAKLSTIDGVHDISDNANEGERELKLRVNEYGQSLGLSEGYITSALRGSFFKGEYAKAFNQEGLLRIKVEDKYKDEKGSIDNFRLTTPEGRVVVLSDVCDFYYQKSFVKIFKEDGDKILSLFARVDKKVIVPNDVMKQIEPLLNKIKQSGIKVIIKGEQKENIKMKREMSQALIIAVFLIFITLVWMFNSFVQPLIILSIIPLSILGVLVGTKLMGINLTMPGVMGIIGLAGVVVNDGLIMLSFVREAKNYKEILEYAKHRVRPIILTSVTTVLGLSSLIFFASGQALILQPMAISLGFGIAWATVLNLYFVPLAYAVIYRIKSVI
ncbi:RND multidrug efflux transporter; Acriflavin resistance protein [hydrothermal vent metagenome]|uniref:RND multidrug efflux transporter Acriflavin resistance protein n=1 Tax=hydrothermal vent metagenome TaxID=652676 RepID=A0A1W1BVD4_9ZZZZ